MSPSATPDGSTALTEDEASFRLPPSSRRDVVNHISSVHGAAVADGVADATLVRLHEEAHGGDIRYSGDWSHQHPSRCLADHLRSMVEIRRQAAVKEAIKGVTSDDLLAIMQAQTKPIPAASVARPIVDLVKVRGATDARGGDVDTGWVLRQLVKLVDSGALVRAKGREWHHLGCRDSASWYFATPAVLEATQEATIRAAQEMERRSRRFELAETALREMRPEGSLRFDDSAHHVVVDLDTFEWLVFEAEK